MSYSWNAGFVNGGFVNNFNVAAGSAHNSNCLFLVTVVISSVRQTFQNEGNEQKKDDSGAKDEGSNSLSIQIFYIVVEIDGFTCG